MTIFFLSGWSISDSFFRNVLKKSKLDLNNFHIINSSKLLSKYDKDNKNYITEIVNSIEEQISAVDSPGEISIQGWSLGGLIALIFCANTKLNIKGLKLFNASGNFVNGSPEREKSLLNLAEGISQSSDSRKIFMKKFYSSLIKNLSLNNRLDLQLVEDLLTQSNEFSLAELKNSLDFLKDVRIQNQTLDITIPVEVICGELDQLIPPAHSKIVSDKLADSHFRIIAGQGHLLPIEYPDILLSN